VLHGVTVTLDTTSLSTTQLSLDIEVGVSNQARFAFTTLPGTFVLQDQFGAGTVVEFTVAADGTVGYDPSLQGPLTGNGTSTLVVAGATFTIDATALSPQLATFNIAGVGNLATDTVQTITVLPGTVSFQAGTLQFVFTISTQDALDYDPSLDNVLSGSGTSQLTVSGPT
jgi:hypothetical protein